MRFPSCRSPAPDHYRHSGLITNNLPEIIAMSIELTVQLAAGLIKGNLK